MFINSTIMKRSGFFLGVASLLTLATVAGAQDQLPTKDAVTTQLSDTQYSPYAGRNFPTQVYWGDTHLHTQVSVDAGTMTRLSQENAIPSPLEAGEKSGSERFCHTSPGCFPQPERRHHFPMESVLDV